jgi:hypothetical protein
MQQHFPKEREVKIKIKVQKKLILLSSSSLNGEEVVVVAVHQISRWRSDPEAVGGGGVEAQAKV